VPAQLEQNRQQLVVVDKVQNRRVPPGLGNRLVVEVHNMEELDIAPPLIDHVVWSCDQGKASASSIDLYRSVYIYLY
jgi:hypothetical protein